MVHTDWDTATRWAKARAISPATKAKLRAIDGELWHWSEFYKVSTSITYQTCRFCKRGHPELNGLWKYSVRHWICDDCFKAAIRKVR